MHCFGRAAIAVGVGVAGAALFGHQWVRFLSGSCPVDDFVDSMVGRELTDAVLMVALGLLIAAGVYVPLGHWPVRQCDTETRCRKCGYVLRGISEPRCSECGERI